MQRYATTHGALPEWNPRFTCEEGRSRIRVNRLDEAVASQIATLSGLSYIADYTNPPRTIGGSVRVAF